MCEGRISMKPKQIKISDVLHLAADYYLCSDNDYKDWVSYQYSCTAIKHALHVLLGFKTGKQHTYLQGIEFRYHFLKIEKGLRNLGLEYPREVYAFRELEDGFEPTKASQGARYIWLKFAALMAEEQGE